VTPALAVRDYLDALAAGAWERVVEYNPVNETYWSRLGQARDQAGDRRGAISAYRRALDLGAGYPFQSAYEIARCFALLGQREEAIAWIVRAFGLGYRDIPNAQSDPDLASIRDDVRVASLLGLIDREAMSRVEGWRYDLEFLGTEVQNKSNHLRRAVSVEQFRAGLETVASRLNTLTDHEVYAELMRAVATLGDGHSGFAAPETDSSFALALPLQFYLFEEGLHVIAADAEHASLVGRRVVSFDDLTAEAVASHLLAVVSRDNDYSAKEQIAYRMRELPLLHSLGLIDAADRVKLTTSTDQGSPTTATVVASVAWPNRELVQARPCPPDWEYAASSGERELPLYLRNQSAYYWFKRLPEDRAIYCQFNSVNDRQPPTRRPDGLAPGGPRSTAADDTLAQFTERLMAACAADDVERLIVDVRWNSGGNSFLAMPLLHSIMASDKLNREGRLFLIIGRRTFSAAQNFVTLLERHANPIFVGEPTGSSPNFVGESTRVRLAYSGATVTISDIYHQSSWGMDHRRWISPHVYAPPTFADFQAGRDAALEAVLRVPEERFAGITRIGPAGRWMPRGN
jgi:tetratricopeptide (TPR) repeat protein